MKSAYRIAAPRLQGLQKHRLFALEKLRTQKQSLSPGFYEGTQKRA